ncbi:MAG: hypothetical protein MUF15_17185 [Acidobacteria bacterium]|jgi:hypothetical protein|nr:hypothetical protein [Acidobacteriota bacterium]
MNNIDNFNLHRLKQQSPGLSLGEDFEARVFAKIKRKKTQRKVAASAALSIAVFAFLYIGQALFLHQNTNEKIFLSHNDTVQPGNIIKGKEEVPLMENVVFASYDQQTNYAVEHVAYNEYENTI